MEQVHSSNKHLCSLIGQSQYKFDCREKAYTATKVPTKQARFDAMRKPTWQQRHIWSKCTHQTNTCVPSSDKVNISLIAVRKPTRQPRNVHNNPLGCHEKAYMATKAHMDSRVLRAACSYHVRS